MRMEWAKEKADRGCEKLAHYLKTRGKDENMFLSASKRNRGHCTGNAVEDTMMADEPARVLPPHAFPKWCDLHNRRYYKKKKDAHACDTFLDPALHGQVGLTCRSGVRVSVSVVAKDCGTHILYRLRCTSVLETISGVVPR